MRREITLKTNKKQSGILARHTCVSRSQLTTGNSQLLRSSPSSPLAKQLTTDNWHLQSSRRSPNRRHQAKLDSYVDPKKHRYQFLWSHVQSPDLRTNWHLQSSRRSPNRRHQAKLDSYIDPKKHRYQLLWSHVQSPDLRTNWHLRRFGDRPYKATHNWATKSPPSGKNWGFLKNLTCAREKVTENGCF